MRRQTRQASQAHMGRRLTAAALAAVMGAGCVAMTPFQAQAEDTGSTGYEIYPNPHVMTYTGGDYIVKNEVNVVFEDVQNQQNENTYKKLSRVQGAIIAWCEIQGVDYDIVAPSHWRSVLGGSWGRKRDEQKQHAIEYVKDVLDKDVSSDEADALCIGLSFIKENDMAW